MPSVNFVVLGDFSVAGELGKKGSVTDMTFHERKSSAGSFSFISPTSFPEKVQPLIQAIALAECAIVSVKSIDKSLGEQIVALDAAGMERGFIIADGLEDDVRKLVKSTVLEKYEFVTPDEIKQRVEGVQIPAADGQAKVVIDAAFEVKGVGTVALGVVRRGAIRKYDEMEIFPQCKPVTIRSIQMHDDDVDSASSPGRVGLALKSVEAKDMSRGDVIASKGSMKSGASFKVRFEKSRFYRPEIAPAGSYHACFGLQIRPAKMEGDSMTLDRPVAFDPGERFVLLDLNSTSVRIAGSGTVL